MRTLPVALGIAGCWTLLAIAGGLETLERLTVQARYAMRPAPGFHAPVTIVAIDERALERYGQMPWDRRVFARLLDRFKAEHAAVVGIDVAFNEPAHDPAQDAALTTSLSHIPTVLPTFLAYADAGRQALRSIEPLAPFSREAAALGSIQLSSRQQDQIWEVEPYQDALGRWVPAFPIAVLGAYKNTAWTPHRPGFPWRDRPTLINFRGPSNSAPQISAVDVLEGHLPPHALEGRMVLLGAVATGLPDTNFAVPDARGGPMSGVELSAHVIDNALNDGFWRRLSPFALVLLMGLLAVWPGRALCRGAVPRSALLAAAVAGWSAIAVAAFFAGVWLEVVPVVGFLLTCYFAGLFVERTDLLESRNQLLGRYASDLAGESQRQRARIEGELHDGIQQLLVVMGREIRQVQRAVGGEAVASRVELLGQLTDQAQQEIKRLRSDLLPPALRYGGLLEALPVLASEKRARTGLDVRLEVVSWEALPREREIELYWLVSEALNNAEKHADPRTVTLRLERTRDEAVLEVIDDGQGFTPPDLSVAPSGVDHSGLHRMWLRMRGNHGDLQIQSAPGQGTRVRFSLPVEARRNV
jgi:signal transduction histidine kinase